MYIKVRVGKKELLNYKYTPYICNIYVNMSRKNYKLSFNPRFVYVKVRVVNPMLFSGNNII